MCQCLPPSLTSHGLASPSRSALPHAAHALASNPVPAAPQVPWPVPASFPDTLLPPAEAADAADRTAPVPLLLLLLLPPPPAPPPPVLLLGPAAALAALPLPFAAAPLLLLAPPLSAPLLLLPLLLLPLPLPLSLLLLPPLSLGVSMPNRPRIISLMAAWACAVQGVGGRMTTLSP